MDSSPKN